MTEQTPAAPEAVTTPALNIPQAAIDDAAARAKAEAPVEPKADAKPSESEKSAEPEAKPEDAEKDDKPKKRWSERVAELTARSYQQKAIIASKDQEIERLTARNAEYEKAWERMSPEQQQAAQLRHTLNQDKIETAQAEKTAAEAQAKQVRDEAIFTKAQDAAARIPDFADAWNVMLANPLSSVGADFIAESEKGGEIAYYLGKNPSEAQRIAKLDPIKQAVEFARIEGRLSAPPVRKVSQAPTPPPTLGGSKAPRSKSYEEMSMAEYSAAYKARAKG